MVATRAFTLPRCTAETFQRGFRHSRGFCRWRDGQMVLRWAAAVYLITEKSFRKIQGYQDLWMLQALLDETQTAVQQQVA